MSGRLVDVHGAFAPADENKPVMPAAVALHDVIELELPWPRKPRLRAGPIRVQAVTAVRSAIH